MDLYDRIVDPQNFITAYFSLIEKFSTRGLNAHYRGSDGVALPDIAFDSSRVIKEAREELLSNEPVRPVLRTLIPKRKGGMREIYIYAVKDRIKAQAIYQVLQPFFETVYSPFLFSYRPGKASHFAARSAVRRYHRHFGEDHIITADLTQYTENIHRDILIDQLSQTGLDARTLGVMESFMAPPILDSGAITHRKIGVTQGIPLIPLFANIYLNEFDWKVGKSVSFYRRVGDDFMATHPQRDRLAEVFEMMKEHLAELKIHFHPTKTRFIRSDESFDFLGYQFSHNLVSLPPEYVQKSITKWKRLFAPRDMSDERKRDFLRKILLYDTAFSHELAHIIRQHPYIEDQQQIEYMNFQLHAILARFCLGVGSPRSLRKLKEFLGFNPPSLTTLFIRHKYFYHE